jgi:hypothetical protein
MFIMLWALLNVIIGFTPFFISITQVHYIELLEIFFQFFIFMSIKGMNSIGIKHQQNINSHVLCGYSNVN